MIGLKRMARTAVMPGSAMLVLLVAGCASTSHLTAKVPWKKFPEPTRMVLMVTPSTAEGTSYSIHPGLMCRAYFFFGKDPRPVQVKGDLCFTAYDRVNPNPDGSPQGKYVIPADELDKHLRRDVVGDSYVFWLPFDPPTETQVLVQGEFTPKHGNPIVSSGVSVELSPPASGEPLAGRGTGDRPKSFYRTYRKPVGSAPYSN